MPAAGKRKKPPIPTKKKPSPAAAARAALDPDPPKPLDDAPPPERERAPIERARPPPRLLTRAEMLARVALTYPTVWKMMIAGTFPRGRAIGNGRVSWLESEIEEWIEDLPRRELKGDAEKTA
jgi:prophage regulatory protein